ncbi:MAG: lasso peptide biosynthesis protein [Gammaproteobacteria bacterium]|nr:lasso peptide biosynthesis protein [Gammaproteobacteria bacterium]
MPAPHPRPAAAAAPPPREEPHPYWCAQGRNHALEAHAWLSWQGRVLNDAADVSKRYAELQTEQWDRISRFID